MQWVVGGHMLNTNCLYNQRTDKKKTIPFPGDRPQQQTALAGVIAAAHWVFMKQYFFLITARTHTRTHTALSKSLCTVESLTLTAPLGDKSMRHRSKQNLLYLS